MRFVNNLKTTFLLSCLVALCMFVGHVAMPGPNGMLFGFLFGGFGAVLSYLFSDRIAMAAMGGHEISRSDLPWLFDMIERLAERAGLPMPRVYVCPQAAPNAFATGRSPRRAAVAITEGMLRGFPREEIEGVMAHELAHIKHRDMLIGTIAAVMAGMLSYAGYMLFWFGGGGHGSRENHNPLGALGAILLVVLAPIAAMLIQMAISRQREYAADSYGGELCGDPRKLAYALRRLAQVNERVPTDTNPAFHSLYICQPLSRSAMGSWMSSHPPIEERIALLEAQASRIR